MGPPRGWPWPAGVVTVGVAAVVAVIIWSAAAADVVEERLAVPMTIVAGAASRGAVCLDGSPPAYHLHRGSGAGARNWLLQFEGGGWCNDVRSCAERAGTRRGSTRLMPKVEFFSGILSNRPAMNPGAFTLMHAINQIPHLKGDNYAEWRKRLDCMFVLAEVDWVLSTPCPVLETPVRQADESDDAWAKRKADHAPIEMAHSIKLKRWEDDNKKCVAVIENTIETSIIGSIQKCNNATEFLEKIKSQFHGSSKTYATMIIREIMTEKYTGGTGIRQHISKMNHLNNKLKPMGLNLKEEFLVHMVFASLPKKFDNFVINYNVQPEQWNLERCIAMCVQEEDRIKAANGGVLNFVKDNNKRKNPPNANSPSKAKNKGPMKHLPQQNQFIMDKDQCLYCKKKGHHKKDCPDFLKSILAKNGVPFDANYAKKRKTH